MPSATKAILALSVLTWAVMGNRSARTSEDADSLGKGAGEVYKAVIEEQLKFERDRKTSLEQRALAVVTSSGVLVTLLLGLIAAIDRHGPSGVDRLPRLSALGLAAATVLFVAAATVALLANAPRNYGLFSLRDLRRMVTRDLWEGPTEHAERRVAEVTVELVDRARVQNRRKAQLLLWALCMEVTAVAAMAIAAIASIQAS
jgi:hypothetical protein